MEDERTQQFYMGDDYTLEEIADGVESLRVERFPGGSDEIVTHRQELGGVGTYIFTPDGDEFRLWSAGWVPKKR